MKLCEIELKCCTMHSVISNDMKLTAEDSHWMKKLYRAENYGKKKSYFDLKTLLEDIFFLNKFLNLQK